MEAKLPNTMEREKFKKVEKMMLVGGLLVLLLTLLWRVPLSVLGLATEEKKPPDFQTRTLKFFIFQEPAVLVSPTSTTTDFSIFIGESAPVVRDAYIEVRGVTKAAASQQIKVDLRAASGSTCIDSFPDTLRAKTFTLDSTGQSNHFRILYTGTSTASSFSPTYCLKNIITSPGTYNFQLRTDINGADVSTLQARLVLTYQYTPATEAVGGLPATGEVISTTFDTYAVNGANFNWILWKGIKPAGTRVRLQLATSNCSNGATDPSTCLSGSWGATGSDYLGSACTNSTWFEPVSATSIEIPRSCTTHNNKRYFRYKVQLCSNTDCSTAGSNNPEVQDVIVNFSP